MKELTELRRQVLEELMNISFGKAVGAISQIISGHLLLKVPEVKLVDAQEVIKILSGYIGETNEINLVQQVFRGDFYGEAALVFPGPATEILVEMLALDGSFIPHMSDDGIKKEAVLEVGNIVIGTCLSQFSDLLNTSISFSPPKVFAYELTSDRFKEHITTENQTALLIYTTFEHKKQKLTGYLFFFLSEECLDWLFKVTDSYLDNI